MTIKEIAAEITRHTVNKKSMANAVAAFNKHKMPNETGIKLNIISNKSEIIIVNLDAAFIETLLLLSYDYSNEKIQQLEKDLAVNLL